MLCLDEPTNHLDLHAVLWLEDYLLKWKKTVLLVSHAREFLNAVCTDIVHLHTQALTTYRGTFDNFVKSLNEVHFISLQSPAIINASKVHSGAQAWAHVDRGMHCQHGQLHACHVCHIKDAMFVNSTHDPCVREGMHFGHYDVIEAIQLDLCVRLQKLRNQAKQAEAMEAKRKHMQAFVDKFRYNAKRASLVQSRIKAIDKLEDVQLMDRDAEYVFHFPLPDASITSSIVSFTDVHFGYPGGPELFHKLNFGIDLDTRAAIVGPNGALAVLLNLHCVLCALLPCASHPIVCATSPASVRVANCSVGLTAT